MSKKHNKNNKKQEQKFEEKLEEHIEEVQEQLDDDYEDEAHDNEVEELNKKISSLQEALLRNQAELQNYKRRKDEESEKVLKYKNEELIKEILPIIDNFERAIKMDNQDLSDEVSKFLEGFKLIYTTLINILSKYDVKEIATDGIEFNPDIHEAVMTEGEGDVQVIGETLRPGYYYEGDVLRPAMVKVICR